jgi:glycosyltransferase involved in cell wall biosynthesis
VGSGKSLNDLQISFNTTSDRIKYHGYVSNELLCGIYQQANLFINCSDNEGLPVSLVEAMKHGLIPIVNSWNGSANDLVENSINGFIVVDNRPEEYVNVILKLNALNNTLLSMSKRAFSITTERHSLKNQITKFESILFELESITVNREPLKIYGSRLDSPYIPNCVTKTIRNIMNLSNG